MARPNSRAHRRRHRSQGSLEQGTIDIQREQVAKRYGVVSLCASAAWWVQMRCRECAAEVAVTARVCSGCGAPIVGQPSVVAWTRWSPRSADAAGKAVPAGWPGRRCRSRMCRVRAIGSLRSFGWCWLVTSVLLVACSLRPWPAPRLLSLSMLSLSIRSGCCSSWPSWCVSWGFVRALDALKAGIRFSRLLRRPGDPHTATVMASKRGGRTLILDIPPTGRGYQPLSEVRLALWMKAGMLVPGERVNVYGGSGDDSPLLISSAAHTN